MRAVYYSLLLLVILNLQAQSDPHVLLVSFDGFRHDYVDLYETPNFDLFIAGGSAAEALIPAFPSKTFPNHYTLVTGLYPGNHGLVDNSFYDSERDVIYTMRKRNLVEDNYFYGGTPLWQLVQQHGLKSASYFWVGSEAEIKGSYPDYYYRYDGRVPNDDRIAKIKEWLALPDEERPRLITLYFSLVDSQGHATGPISELTGESVSEADRLLGLIMEAVGDSELQVNVLLTSDHGMQALKNDASSYFRLDQKIDFNREGLEVVSNGTHMHFYFKNSDKVNSFYNELKLISDLQVYLKAETPKHWHYRNHGRIGDIVVTAPLGKVFSSVDWNPELPGIPYIGVHGYDPSLSKDLNGIFYANGPDIKQSYTLEAFENVHVYPFICQLLEIQIPKNIDGRADVLEEVLRRQ